MTDRNSSGDETTAAERDHPPALAVIRAIGAAERRRFDHRHTATRRKKALVYVGLALLLPIVGLILWGAYLFGQSVADGGTEGALNLARWYLPVGVVTFAAVAAAEATKRLDDFGARDLLLTSVPDRTLVLGLLYADARESGWAWAGYTVVPVAAFAVGVGSVTTAVVAVPAVVLFVAVSMLLGYVLGIGGRVAVRSVALSGGSRSMLGGIVAAGGPFILSAFLGAYVASLDVDLTDPAALATLAPDGPPPIPLGYYADLFFVGTPMVGAVPPAAVASAVGFVFAVPALTWVVTVLTPRLWDADSPTPTDEDDEAGATDAGDERTGSTVARSRREWPWLASPTGYVADGMVRRTIRMPARSAHLMYYVIAVGAVVIAGVVQPDALVTVLGAAFVMLGIWFAGGIVGLNPIGEEGSMLGQLVLGALPAKTYVRARILTGVVIGVPLVFLGTGLLAASALSPAEAARTGTYWLLLVPASACVAVGVGSLLPATEPGTVFERIDARPPEKLAMLIHGGLLAVLAYGGGRLLLAALEPRYLWGGLALIGLALVIATDVGYRFAVRSLADYGRPHHRDPIYALELVAGLALLGLALSLSVTEGAVILAPTSLSGSSMSLLALLAGFVGWAVAGVAYLLASGRSREYLDVRVPTIADGRTLVIGLLASLAVYASVVAATTFFDAPLTQHTLADDLAAGGPAFGFAVIAIAVLVNGPVEEFVFRNVIQKRLGEAVSPARAILAASIVFALIHVPSYLPAEPFEVALSIAPLAILSVIWGVLYERTNNLLVPALCHGLYNAVVFGVTLLTMP